MKKYCNKKPKHKVFDNMSENISCVMYQTRYAFADGTTCGLSVLLREARNPDITR